MANVMRYYLRALAALFFTYISLAVCAESNYVISDIAPAPNYGDKNYSDYRHRLTDGDVVSHPLWTREGGIGWSWKTPIVIQMENNLVGDQQQFRIHTACRKQAEAKLPQRIDIYSTKKGQLLNHVGAWTNTIDCEDDAVWLTVPFAHQGDDLLIVIHADGVFIFIDEIVLESAQTSTTIKPEPLSADSSESLVDAVIRDSTLRLKNEVADTATASLTKLPAGLSFFTLDPWLPIPALLNNVAFNTPIVLNAFGMQGENESFVLGIANKAATKKLTISTTCPNSILTISQLAPVIAANRQRIYDPLLPLKNQNIEIEENTINYLWITVSLNLSAQLKAVCQLSVNDGKTGSTLSTIAIQIEQIPAIKMDSLAVVLWGYSNDKPIWENRETAQQLLQEIPVNVHVIPPALIPGVTLSNEWNSKTSKQFHDELAAFKKEGLLLLFTAWNQTLLPIGELQNQGPAYQALKKWLVQIKKHLAMEAVVPTNWALYPFDEPTGKDLVWLNTLITAVKEIDPSIRVYVNPVVHEVTSSLDLLALKKNADYWQPDLKTAESFANKLAIKDGKPWWFYNNPIAPAKAANSLTDYRLLAWRALTMGATGIGVWSFSDTAHSSAWDDFDGERPDWALVYESQNGDLVKSRRWEALKKGVEDYQLLKASGMETDTLPAVNELTTSDQLNVIRLKAFQRLQHNSP